MSSAVQIRRDGAVLVVELDDGKANALSTEVIAALADAVATAENDDTVGAMALIGRPGRFCAGFDLDVMRSGDMSAIVGLVSDGGDLVRGLYGSSVPVVAGCTGHALAAGALLLLGCDLRLGADVDCKIGLNEVAIGMVLPDWAITIASERLSVRQLQPSVALATIYSSPTALAAGYLDRVVGSDELYDATLDAAKGLATLDRRAYAGTVRALRGATLDRMAAQIAADRSRSVSPV